MLRKALRQRHKVVFHFRKQVTVDVRHGYIQM
jgi:hypothetical protein